MLRFLSCGTFKMEHLKWRNGSIQSTSIQRTGTVQEWYRNGVGLVQEWYRNGVGMVQERYRNGTGPSKVHPSKVQ